MRISDNDLLYHEDRNWFLFYHLITSENLYTKPVYTNLGNHDWRLNPYPPFTIGAPESVDIFRLFLPANLPMSQFQKLPSKERQRLRKKLANEALRIAHGKGYDIQVSYNKAKEHKYGPLIKAFSGKKGAALDILKKWWDTGDIPIPGKDVLNILSGSQSTDIEGLPTETSVSWVEWYLLSINPFLDYQFSLPNSQSILMLDWAEDENVLYNGSYRGQTRYPVAISTDEGPNLRNCLTPLQTKLVEMFTSAPGMAKIIGIHAPPIAPFGNWYDTELAKGWKEFDPKGRGYPLYSKTIKSDKGEKTIKGGHPFFAIKPARGVIEGAVYGMDAIYGSFEKNREWFIKRLADQKLHIRIVLSGHNHRMGLFVTYKASESMGHVVAGEMLLKSVSLNQTIGVLPPAGAQIMVQKTLKEFELAPGPLYVNGTSVGPLGHLYHSKEEETPHSACLHIY